jgi:hypothetical protein
MVGVKVGEENRFQTFQWPILRREPQHMLEHDLGLEVGKRFRKEIP